MEMEMEMEIKNENLKRIETVPDDGTSEHDDATNETNSAESSPIASRTVSIANMLTKIEVIDCLDEHQSSIGSERNNECK